MDTRLLEASPAGVAAAAKALRSGELVAIPTETVYGLGANALDPSAAAAVFAAKERPTFDPLIVHLAPLDRERPLESEHLRRVARIELLSAEARGVLSRLATKFWPGPLTVVLPKAAAVPELVTGGLETVGVRVPSHPVAMQLLAEAHVPIAAPSANRFGRVSPTCAADVVAELGGRIPWVLDGGPCPVGVESTVVLLDPEGRLTLLRPGGVTLEALEQAAGRVDMPPTGTVQAGRPVASPGMLASHYAPSRPLHVLSQPLEALTDASLGRELAGYVAGSGGPVGVLVMRAKASAVRARLTGIGFEPALVVSLTETGDDREAAQRLFGALRALDASSAATLVREPCPVRHGLWRAIGDRLDRASARGPA
ncbi:MAG: threonylcarbamoyl-AMP synthase [Polyangiaceae bacterium]|nr:threonylcarbamoyl-AMP synthase [Polyangiaceae bacterium]